MLVTSIAEGREGGKERMEWINEERKRKRNKHENWKEIKGTMRQKGSIYPG